ncbi:MAG: pilin [Porticoccaceae bacterium]|nr:pilin [Porticoccaceae bacterium]
MLAASSARTCVTEIVQSSGWVNLASCASGFTASQYATNLKVDNDGTITVEGKGDLTTVEVTLKPSGTTKNHIQGWTCKGTPAKWMPGSCRG